MQKITQQLMVVGVVGAVVVLCAITALFFVPSPNFTASEVTIQPGSTVSQATQNLAESDVVWHRSLVGLPLRVQDKTITAGRYKFSQPQSPLVISRRLAAGDFQAAQQQVVIPEGFTREEIADRLAAELNPEFSSQEFREATSNQEGYLFPDTYRIADDMTAKQIATIMRDNFNKHIDTLQPALQQFPHSQSDIIKMASLVETEAADYQTRRRVAGVLWKRLDEGMPLQADAVFAYLLDKPSRELTQKDLNNDSPYNLYTNTGLPPTPIANPGLEAIRATINPIRTDDLYYLTGDDGSFYFAETLEEHQKNKRQFLNY
jgi:UPF0755 protein